MEGVAATEVLAAAKTPLTAILVTSELVVAEVAVTVPVEVEAPVENPVVNVPVNLPKLAATELVRVIAAEVVPDAMLAKAAATSLAVMFTRAVKVSPLTVTKSLGLSVLNVMRADSVVAAAAPWATFVIVTKLPFVPVAARSAVTAFAGVAVNLITALVPVCAPEA